MRRLALLGFLFLLSHPLFAQPSAADLKQFIWKVPADKDKYVSQNWKKVEVVPSEVVWPGNRVELKSECSHYQKDKGPYLKQGGGKCNMGYWLEVLKGGQVEKIDTIEKLKMFLVPIDSEAKAVTLLALSQDVAFETGKVSMLVLKIEDGFLVETRLWAPFGCTEVDDLHGIFKINSKGTVENVASLETKGQSICRD